MEKLFIEGNDSIPTMDFAPNGQLKMEGRALPEDATGLFTPVFEWIDQLVADKVELDMNLIYFNTAVSKQLYEMFKRLDKSDKIADVEVIWQYEDGDEDSFEAGEMYSEDFPNLKFEFLVYAEM